MTFLSSSSVQTRRFKGGAAASLVMTFCGACGAWADEPRRLELFPLLPDWAFNTKITPTPHLAAHDIANAFARGGDFFPSDIDIFLSGEIDEKTVGSVISELDGAAQTPDKKIRLILNSTGGYVGEGWRLMEKIQAIPNRVDIVCRGDAKSMAAVIFINLPTSKGRRIAEDTCKLMTHEAYLLGPDDKITRLQDADISAADAQRLRDIRESFVSNTALQTEKTAALIVPYFGPEDRDIPLVEALKMGFIDVIIPVNRASNILPTVNVIQKPEGATEEPEGTDGPEEAEAAISGPAIGEPFLFVAPTEAVRPGALKPTLP